MKKLLVVISIAAGLVTFGACQKPEEPQTTAKAPTQQGPIVDTPGAVPGHGTAVKKPEFKVVLPEEVSNAWTGVVLIVEDKKENKKTEFNVNIGEELKIPDSGLTVKIGPFLPDFKMNGQVITSSSNETNNPSVGISVLDDGNKIFPASGEWGWLYSKFPTIHTFMHERYGLALKEGIKK